MSPNDIPAGLRRLLEAQGAKVTANRPINHGTQYDLASKGDTAKLNVYRTGKVSTGGKASKLKDLVEGWRTGGQASSAKKPRGVVAGPRPALDGTRRLGIDESGKGDYFGPLVVAGVRVRNEGVAKALQNIGVRDSKAIGVAGLRAIATRVLDAVGPGNVHVVALAPKEYEERRAAAGNVNELLGDVDAGIICELQGEVELVVVDQYARSAHDRLRPEVSTGVRLEVHPRAENDAAVAAASIVARARQLDEMDRLSEKVGFRLPLGATHVLGAAKRVYAERGIEGLAEVAKVHFATTKKVVGSTDQKG